MININVELMPFQKFVQSILNKLYHDETRIIIGKFKEKGKEHIFTEEFKAHLVGGKDSAEETYNAYIKWFNHTKVDGEEERECVSAIWRSNDGEE